MILFAPLTITAEETIMAIDLDSSTLAKTPGFEISDPESISGYMSSTFRPNKSIITRNSEPVDFRHNSLRFGATTINLVRYGIEALVDAPPTGEIFLAMFTLSGYAQIDQGDSQFTALPGSFCVLNPNHRLRINLSRDFEQLTVKIRGDAVRRSILQLTHREINQPLEFAPRAYPLEGQAASFGRLINTICDDSLNQTGMNHPQVSKHLEEAMVNLLLTSFSHNYSVQMMSDLYSLTPNILRRAEDFIMANLDQSICVSEVAKIAGASVRSIQNAFKNYRNTTLTTYIREVRLERAREALLIAESTGQNITDIAFAHGFTHLSKFAEYYKKRFGESPSQTKSGLRTKRVHD